MALAFVNNSIVVEDWDRTWSRGQAWELRLYPLQILWHIPLLHLRSVSDSSLAPFHLTLSQYLMIYHMPSSIFEQCMVGNPLLTLFTSSSTVSGASLNVLQPRILPQLRTVFADPSRECLETPLSYPSTVSRYPLSLFYSTTMCLSLLLNSRK